MASTMLGTGGAMPIQCTAFIGLPRDRQCWVVAGEVGTAQLGERTLFLASMDSFTTSVPINVGNRYVQANMRGFVYGAFSVVTVAIVWFLVPETKDRSLVELDDKSQAQVRTREFRNYVRTGLGAEITDLGRQRDQEEQAGGWMGGGPQAADSLGAAIGGVDV
ncbi:hypothetical protein BJY01DRAFT_214175 [Aspergillus pseudoustus]|uniref:Major facilitator superfamily (MFS) profile domain-containing protein n=1 Tax=Aspergillus pseudoustus TaxID=1810923 RepID=A0ABR4JZK7_9EURO